MKLAFELWELWREGSKKETAHLKTTQIIETKWMYTVSVVMFFNIFNSYFFVCVCAAAARGSHKANKNC